MKVYLLKLGKSTRFLVQSLFALTTLWIGVKFILFVLELENQGPITTNRPPGVEAFLPISALISLKYWVLTGHFNTIHPAGLIILLVILSTALFLKKGFCSWVCPIGFLSEILAKIHVLIYEKPRKIFKWVDYPLRSLKYLLLIFFLWAILYEMNVQDLQAFIFSPYNQVADIKMLKFFSEISRLTLYTLLSLALFSILIRHFWCRYLCPYGALLGVTSMASLFRIRRNESSCIDCQKCTKECPANINVHKLKSVSSDECHACMQCVDACLVPDTLYFSRGRIRIKKWLYGIIITALFITGAVIGRWTGYWKNSISLEEYKHHIKHLEDPVYQHNRGQVPTGAASANRKVKFDIDNKTK